LKDVTLNAIPEDVTARIYQAFGLDRCISLAYIYEGTLYGTSVLVMKEGLPDPQEELLRSFASLAAVSLRRNRAEERLIKSLEEKNVLIKEVHHRVKNNLQVIISLLNLQAARISDPGARSLQNESIARLHSMALIHESIYRSENFVDIDMGPYVKELVSLLLATYSMDESAIRVAISVRDVSLNVDRAIPCALLLNELVTNVLKHGIKKDSGPGQMDLSFTRSRDAFCLVVADRGPCMDADAFYSEKQKTLGIQLIKALVRQLGGTVELTINDGCSFAIKFPVAV
jgi:two-component sensor histidine kinase